MTVHFIGAGPGAADLITVRGRDLIAQCPVCLYAGSIVPKELLQYCPPGARIEGVLGLYPRLREHLTVTHLDHPRPRAVFFQPRQQLVHVEPVGEDEHRAAADRHGLADLADEVVRDAVICG